MSDHEPTDPPSDPVVVLVEDDDIDAMAVERSIRRVVPDLRIERACDGVEGLDVIRRVRERTGGRFVTVLDLNMPRMNGVEALAELRADPELAPTITFVLTTSDDARDLDSAYEYNVAGYLVKAVDGVATTRIANLVANYFQMVSFPPVAV